MGRLISPWTVPGFCLRVGTSADRALLLQFMGQAYQETHPSCSLQHLSQTLDQYWSHDTPVWFVRTMGNGQAHRSIDIACLWLGRAVDQISGTSYTHVFLLCVQPLYRRQGIGRGLMQRAEAWARHQGDTQIGVQVLQQNPVAQQLYAQLGYQTQALCLLKPLSQS